MINLIAVFWRIGVKFGILGTKKIHKSINNELNTSKNWQFVNSLANFGLKINVG